MKNTRLYGKIAETAAADYLEQNGYKILCRNYCIKGGEIDLVAEKGADIFFVEVKARNISSNERPIEAVDRTKRERLCSASEKFLEEYRDNEYINALTPKLCVVEIYTNSLGKAAKIALFTDSLY